MGQFFNTFFTKSLATAGKVVAGVGIGLMTVASVAATLPIIPLEWRIISGIAFGVGSMLGLHAVHRAPPPVVPIADR